MIGDPMQIPIKEIAELVEGEVEGDSSIVISGVSGIKEAKRGEITFIANRRYASLMDSTSASAIIVSRDIANGAGRTLIKTDDPYHAFTRVMGIWANGNGQLMTEPGIHPRAVIGSNVKLGKSVSIQAFAVIEDYAEIGDNAVILPQVYIGRKTKIGAETLIYPGVTIREKVSVGKRCIIHSGTVIGSDGFGFAPVKGTHHKVPQIGTVIIEDDVEIGANVAIDRATIGKTQIGRGTKIDNLVQIAHNVVIGKNSIIVSQVGLSGSCAIGEGVTIAGQAGVTGHITVGNNSTVAARAGVTKSVPADSCVSGFPAQPHDREKRLKVSLLRVPETNKKVKELEKRIKALEGLLDKRQSYGR
jgi:UDP-3-O-[3-hydroxymyristoyl] glucosamine N-acyltransferase